MLPSVICNLKICSRNLDWMLKCPVLLSGYSNLWSHSSSSNSPSLGKQFRNIYIYFFFWQVLACPLKGIRVVFSYSLIHYNPVSSSQLFPSYSHDFGCIYARLVQITTDLLCSSLQWPTASTRQCFCLLLSILWP